jgi:MOSC domain-containing protein YiiM
MQLISVNIGSKRTQPKGDELETTGIYKLATREPVRVTRLGLEADFICDTENHGGPDQAVYIYGATDYAWWSAELGKDLVPGTFGENLTVSDLESAQFGVGDRIRVGSASLEITGPRAPCSTLAARMRDPMFVKKYRRAERPGLYCRVLQEGTIRAGEQVTVEAYAGPVVTTLELFREHYRRHKDEATLRRLLRAPVAVRIRVNLEQDLKKLLGDA